MDNIKARKESFSNWRSEFEIDEGKKLIKPVVKQAYKAGKKTLSKALSNKHVQKKYHSMVDGVHAGVDNLVKIGVAAGIPLAGIKLQKNKKVSEEVEGGVSVENYADGVQFNEIETVDIIKPEPLNHSNWRNDLNVLDEKKISKTAVKALKNTAKTGATVGATTGVLKAIDRATDTTDAALNIMTSTFAAGNNQRNKAQSEDERLTKRRIQIANNAVGYTPYVTTSESNVSEGNRTNYKGIGVSGSGNKKDMSKGPNEPAPVDYRWIQAKNPKKKPSSKKNPGLGDFKPSDKIYAGYEPEGKIVENAAVKALVKGKNLNKLRKGLLQSTGLASGIANMMSKSGIPDDINKEAPADIKKELDKPQVVKDKSHGKKLLDDLVGNPMKDKYNKDALDNEKTDSILDPAGDQKKKPSLEQLKKAAKKRRKKVEESNWREEIELG